MQPIHLFLSSHMHALPYDNIPYLFQHLKFGPVTAMLCYTCTVFVFTSKIHSLLYIQI